MSMEQRVFGALVGVAYGDAMGMPSEFFTRAQIKRRFGEITQLLPGQQGSMISSSFQAGDVTDDTMMTLLVAEMLIERGGEPDAALLIQKMKNWAARDQKGKLVVGPSTRVAFEKIEQGLPMGEAGKMGATNGAAMKIAPVGMVTRAGDLKRLVGRVAQVCLPTHNTGAAIAGASAVAAAVSRGIEGGSIEDMMADAIDAARLGEREGYEVVSASVAERILLARELVERGGADSELLDAIYDRIGAGLPIAESVPAAFAVLMISGGDPSRCVRLAANLGGDTDTIGAMAGAMCGAFSGPNAFPAGDIARIESVNGIQLKPVAEALARLRCEEMIV